MAMVSLPCRLWRYPRHSTSLLGPRGSRCSGYLPLGNCCQTGTEVVAGSSQETRGMLGICIAQESLWSGLPYATEEWGFPGSQSSDMVRLWEH